jgi:hypothetical protein
MYLPIMHPQTPLFYVINMKFGNARFWSIPTIPPKPIDDNWLKSLRMVKIDSITIPRDIGRG